MMEQLLLEDSDIIARVKDGDGDCFGDLVKRYQLPICRYLFHLTGNYEASQDLAQDTFIAAYQGILKNGAGLSFKPWLYRIATNNAWQYHRRRKIISFIPFLDVTEYNHPEDAPDSIDDKLQIREALQKVPQEQRTCMLLHFVEGFKYGEIAAIVGASEEAVRKRVARGSREFREIYQKGE